VSDPTDHVRAILDNARIDAREALGTALAKVNSEFSLAGRLGSNAFYGACEREIRTVYEVALTKAVGLLSGLPASTPIGRHALLDEFAAEVAALIQASQNGLRTAAGRYQGP
jgi:hypothetical protein